MAESWQADANGILVFVRLSSNPVLHIGSSIIDWFILCYCRFVDFCVNSGYSTESTGHLQLLPRTHLPGYCRSKSIQYFELPPRIPTPVFSTKVCSLGELALVLELGDQHYLCSTCDVATAMGTKIPQGHPDTLQSTQASSDPYVLFRRGGEESPSAGD